MLATRSPYFRSRLIDDDSGLLVIDLPLTASFVGMWIRGLSEWHSQTIWQSAQEEEAPWAEMQNIALTMGLTIPDFLYALIGK